VKGFVGGYVVGGLMLVTYYDVNQPLTHAAAPAVASPAPLLDYAVELDVQGVGTASGAIVFVAGGVTDIITCDHAVGKKTTADVIYHGVKFTGRIARADERNDLALITVRGEIGPHAPIDLDAITPRQPELVVGSPYGRGLEITQGFVSRYSYVPGQNELMIQGSAASYPGNSGGPVFVYNNRRHRWEVTGIIDGAWSEGNQVIPTINYAIPSSRILLFMGIALPTAGA
jgi:S1-C subfamily serine protease